MIEPAFITRMRSGRGFAYFHNGKLITDQSLIKYLRGLAIPASWRNVLISPFGGTKVLAKGIDETGRKRSIINPKFSMKS